MKEAADVGNAAAELAVAAAEDGAAAAPAVDKMQALRGSERLPRLRRLADAILQARAACRERDKRSNAPQLGRAARALRCALA